MNITPKVRIKRRKMNFLKSSFVGVNRLFVLVYSNQDDSKKFKNSKLVFIKKHK